jgi:hypothetical protein
MLGISNSNILVRDWQLRERDRRKITGKNGEISGGDTLCTSPHRHQFMAISWKVRKKGSLYKD